jgi:hypothetical protein
MTTPPDPTSAPAKRTAAQTVLIGVVLAGLALLAVGVAIAFAISEIGDVQMSAAGWGAMALGIVLTLGLGIGLMSLVFISNRRGYDEHGHHRR